MILLCKEFTKVWLNTDRKDKQFIGILSKGDVFYTISLADREGSLCLFYCLTRFGAGFIYVNDGALDDQFFEKI